MTWLADHWLDLLGWAGSALLIVSLLQARVLRFRVLNLIAGLMLVAFNAAARGVADGGDEHRHRARSTSGSSHAAARAPRRGGLPGARRCGRTTSTSRTCCACTGRRAAVPARLRLGRRPHQDRHPFLIVRGDETVGVVIMRVDGDEVAHVELDYVTRRYRDFSPGEFVWRQSGVLRDLGIRRVVTSPHHGEPVLRTRRLPT